MRPPGGITGRRRRMAPAELGAALVETIGQARAQSREQVMSAYRSFIPAGVGLDDLFTGKGNFNRVFDDARSSGSLRLTGVAPQPSGLAVGSYRAPVTPLG